MGEAPAPDSPAPSSPRDGSHGPSGRSAAAIVLALAAASAGTFAFVTAAGEAGSRADAAHTGGFSPVTVEEQAPATLELPAAHDTGDSHGGEDGGAHGGTDH